MIRSGHEILDTSGAYDYRPNPEDGYSAAFEAMCRDEHFRLWLVTQIKDGFTEEAIVQKLNAIRVTSHPFRQRSWTRHLLRRAFELHGLRTIRAANDNLEASHS